MTVAVQTNRNILARLVVLVGTTLVGCTAAVNTRDAAEIENMWRDNVIPKTTASTFVTSFARYCVGAMGRLGSLPERLRSADYVQIASRGGFSAFVTDSKKPFVAFRQSPTADHCYVLAEARTGQRRAVEQYVNDTYPGAVPIDPKNAKLPADRAWLIGRDPDTMIYTIPSGSTFHAPRLAVGIIRL